MIAEDLSKMNPRRSSGRKLSNFLLQPEDCGPGSTPASPSAEELSFGFNNSKRGAAMDQRSPVSSDAVAPWSPVSPYAMSPWTPILERNSFGCIASMERQDGHVYAIAADGELLYTGSESKNIRAWRHPSFEEAGCLESGSGSVKAILVVGEKIFSAHHDNKIRVWEHRRDNHDNNKNSNNFRRLATLPTLRVRIRNCSNPRNYVEVRRRRKCVRVEHVDTISSLACDVDRGLLYSGSWDRTVKVWRLSDLRCLQSIDAHDDAVNSVAVGSDGSLFTGSTDGAVKMWRWIPAEVRHVLAETLRIGQQPTAVNALAVGRNILYAGLSDGGILYWDERRVCASFRGHKLAVLCLATAGGLLFSGSEDKTVGVWRREAGGFHSRLAGLGGHAGPVKCIAASVDVRVTGRCLVFTGSLDRSVKIWSVSLDQHPDDEYDDYTKNPVLSPAWVQGKLRA